MTQFYGKTKVCYGEDALETLEHLEAQHAFLVTDPFMVKTGFLDRVKSHLDRGGIAHRTFDGVEPDPSLETVIKGTRLFLQEQADVVIALGGGSAIDTAKAIAFFAYKAGDGRPKPLLVAIPTTSGTGSEVTAISVVTDKANEVKIPLNDEMLIPDIAILDARFTRTLPPSVTAVTGMDVLTHAIEAFDSTGSNDFSDALAEKAIALTWRYLPQVFNDEKDIAARTHMHNASCMAGMAFNSAGLGLVHGMAHAIGGMLHIPHGKINAMLLPIVIDFNSKRASTETRDRYHRCAQIIGIDHAVPEQAIALMTQEIRQINRHFCIPVTLSELGIDRAKIIELRSALVNSTLADGCTASNPRQVTTHDVEGLIDLITG